MSNADNEREQRGSGNEEGRSQGVPSAVSAPTPLASKEASPPPPLAKSAFGRKQREAVALAIGVSLATAVAIRYAFSPEHAGALSMLVAPGLLYAIFTVVACIRLSLWGELRTRFLPASGDLTLGAATAGLLYGLAHLVKHVLTPHASLREAWILRLYLQLGDPEAHGRELFAGAVVLVAALEEITWRGLVMRSLQAAYGLRRALLISSLLFGAAHLPTLFVLADPVAGPNPLIVLGALGCSLVWGGIFARTSRLVPAIFAHVLFSVAVVEFPIWRP
jgi:membrane protease YdiL (CAAX protease family)